MGIKLFIVAALVAISAHNKSWAVLPMQKLFPSVSSFQYFGRAVAATPNYVAVGASNSVSVYQARTGILLRKVIGGTLNSAEFGGALAINANTLLVGDAMEDNDRGSATLFDLTTGKLLRRLVANDAMQFDYFGSSVALWGSLAVVGAPGADGNTGAVYVFDASTGVQLRKLVPSSRQAGDFFGRSVALTSRLALVGSERAQEGKVYGFDLLSTATTPVINEQFSFSASDGSAGDFFGASIAVCGRYAVVGAPRASPEGAAYLIDLIASLEVAKLTPSDSNLNEQFGASVAISDGLVLVGAPGIGKCYVFDRGSGGRQLRLLSSRTNDSSAGFGYAIALSGGMAVVGASSDNDNFYGPVGAAYFWHDLASSFPGSTLMESSGFAPHVPQALVSSFSSFYINADQATSVQATMSGSATAGGKNVAIWNVVSEDTYPGLLLRTRDTVPVSFSDITLATVSSATYDREQWLRGTLAGPGINSSNSAAILSSIVSNTTVFAQQGAPLTGLGPELVSAFQQVTTKGLGMSTALTFRAGNNGVSAINDSAILCYAPYTIFLAREGELSSIGDVKLGQIQPRVSANTGSGTYSCALTQVNPGSVDSTNNAALFIMNYEVGSGQRTDTAIARKGDAAPGMSSTAKFSAFIGECPESQILFRATVSGVAGTANEGIFVTQFPDSPVLVIQKGQGLPQLPVGVRIACIQRFWVTANGGFFVQAKLSGPGVTTMNDTILLRMHGSSPFTPHIIMREGDTAPDCNGARIGVIQQVDVNSEDSSYAIIATLTGAGSDASNNLALWKGRGSLGSSVADEAYAGAFLALRKGGFIESGSLLPSNVSTFRMSIPIDASGAGNRGLGSCVGGERAAILITLSDKRMLAMKL